MTTAARPGVGRLVRVFQWTLWTGLGLSVAVAIVLKVGPVRELFWKWIPIYVKEGGHEHTGHFYLYDPRLGWRNVPNRKSSTRGNPLTINSQGLRDREYSYRKPGGVGRLLVLGDSFAWGYGVADREVFSEVLERRLQADRRSWQVVNTGVSGWGTDQQYLFLIDEGFRYQPDVVVLAFYLTNDPREVSRSDVYGLSKPVFLNKQLTLGNLPVPRPSQAKSGLTSPVDPFDMVVTLIEAINTACRSHNCRLVVMKFGRFADPKHQGLLEIERRFEAAFAACRKRIPYLDLDAEFARRNIRPKLLVAGNEDDHWNQFGHEQAGMILGEFLDEHKLLGVSGRRGAAESPATSPAAVSTGETRS